MTNFRLHTPEELQKIAEEDFERFKVEIENYNENHWEYYLDNVIPVLLIVSKLNDSSNTYFISELNKIGEKDYNKLKLIAKKIYKIDYEFYVNNARAILNKSNTQSKHINKEISNFTESEIKPRQNNNFYTILIVFLLVIISLAIFKYFYDIKILNEEIIKKENRHSEEIRKYAVEDSINKVRLEDKKQKEKNEKELESKREIEEQQREEQEQIIEGNKSKTFTGFNTTWRFICYDESGNEHYIENKKPLVNNYNGNKIFYANILEVYTSGTYRTKYSIIAESYYVEFDPSERTSSVLYKYTWFADAPYETKYGNGHKESIPNNNSVIDQEYKALLKLVK